MWIMVWGMGLVVLLIVIVALSLGRTAKNSDETLSRALKALPFKRANQDKKGNGLW